MSVGALSQASLEARLLSRAQPAGGIWGGASASPANRGVVPVLGLPIDDCTLEAAAADVVDAALRDKRMQVAFVNAHVVNEAGRNPAYRRALTSCGRLYADGSGMAIAARMQGTPLADNVNGTDLLPVLCAQAVTRGARIFLFGAGEGIAAAAAETLRRAGLGDAIAGTHHGYVDDAAIEQQAIDAINASGATIVLVGMGVPRQEVWLAANRHRITAPVVAGVGGLFDFFAGRVSRAPHALRAAGLEWTWRLAQEPRRMWQRYLLGNVSFLARAAVNAVGQRLARRAAVGAPVIGG